MFHVENFINKRAPQILVLHLHDRILNKRNDFLTMSLLITPRMIILTKTWAGMKQTSRQDPLVKFPDCGSWWCNVVYAAGLTGLGII